MRLEKDIYDLFPGEPCDQVCPSCSRLEQTSTVLSWGVTQTLLGYWSPTGHDHDDNPKIGSFRCSEGHYFTLRYRSTCEACDWKGSDRNDHDHVLGYLVWDKDGKTILETIYTVVDRPNR